MTSNKAGRPKESVWKVRASGVGYYLGCETRAAFDRSVSEGTAVLDADAIPAIEEAKKSSPAADFGTCAHFHLQDGLRCVFPSDAKDFAPEESQLQNAARMFGGDLTARDDMIRQVALLAARHLPATPDGKPWLSEHEYETRDLKGHIDFVSQCSTVIVDLKTTGKPLPGEKAKPEHLAQLCAYWLLVKAKTGVEPRTGYLLYVSSAAQWATLVTVDFTTEGMREYIQQIADYAKYLRSKALYTTAVPRFGAHCSDSWCPYKAICRDKVLPAAGTRVEGTVVNSITSQPKMKGMFT